MRNVTDVCICRPLHMYQNGDMIFYDAQGLSAGDIISCDEEKRFVSEKYGMVFGVSDKLENGNRWIILPPKRATLQDNDLFFPNEYAVGMRVFGGELFEISKNMYEKNKNQFIINENKDVDIFFVDRIEKIPCCVVMIR